MNYLIRYAQPDDISDIIELCAAHSAYEKCAYNPAGKVEKLSEALFSASPKLYCLLVQSDNKNVGYATFMKEYSTWDADYYLHMDCLFIDEAYRGFGLGEKLVAELAKFATEQNINLIQWQTPDFNERAIKFYYRIGATSKAKLRMYLEREAIQRLS